MKNNERVIENYDKKFQFGDKISIKDIKIICSTCGVNLTLYNKDHNCKI